MHDINEISKLLGVSKVTIYKKLKNLAEIKPYIIKQDDKTYLLDEGLELIKVNLKGNKGINSKSYDEVASTVISGDLTTNKELINLLINQLKEKDNQIKEKDKQILELHKLIENNQVLLKQQQDKEIKQLCLEEHFKEVDNKLVELKTKMENKKVKKKSFLKKIFE